MDVQINWWAVALAPVASMVVGMIWYAKPVFGNMWAQLVKLDEKRQREGMAKAMFGAVAASLVTGWVLAHATFLSNYFYGPQQGYSWMSSALMTAFFMWLGFQLTMAIVHDGFEQRPMKLTLLTAGNQLATMLATGLVIGLLEP